MSTPLKFAASNCHHAVDFGNPTPAMELPKIAMPNGPPAPPKHSQKKENMSKARSPLGYWGIMGMHHG